MVRNPSVFLLDEPLSNLDAKLRTQMRTEISKLHKKLGTTFVYVTHDQTEAMTMGDRICVMKDGVIQQYDTPQNLYSHPCNLFVAGFIGSPQMNFIDATVIRSQDGFALEFGGFCIPIPQGKIANVDLNGYVNKTVVLGLRPEDLHMEEAFLEMSKESVISAEVEIAEMMGAEIYLYLQCQGQRMIARVPSRTRAASGDQIQIAIDRNKMHLFDKETEQVIFN